METVSHLEEHVRLLDGGFRRWWDVREARIIEALTLYIPFGCPDWGTTMGRRNELCTFCALPNAVADYRQAFFSGRKNTAQEMGEMFVQIFEEKMSEKIPHTLMVFNAGSFLAMPAGLQQMIVSQAARAGIKRLVIESRAALVEERRLPLVLEEAGKMAVTVRIGVETQDDNLRLNILKKGHDRLGLQAAMEIMKREGVAAGGYALLNPAPGLERTWRIREAKATIYFILQELGMEECYFCATNVGPGTPLEREWRAGRFRPATLWEVLKVLLEIKPEQLRRVHLLPFKDVPPYLAVPAMAEDSPGLREDLSDATESEREFHKMFQEWRETRGGELLKYPEDAALPGWF